MKKRKKWLWIPIVAVILAYRGKSLLTVSLAASAAVMVVEFLLKFVK